MYMIHNPINQDELAHSLQYFLRFMSPFPILSASLPLQASSPVRLPPSQELLLHPRARLPYLRRSANLLRDLTREACSFTQERGYFHEFLAYSIILAGYLSREYSPIALPKTPTAFLRGCSIFLSTVDLNLKRNSWGFADALHSPTSWAKRLNYPTNISD